MTTLMDRQPESPSSDLASPTYRSGSALTSLIGRDDDVARVEALLTDPGVRLVTLTGPGGVGKTRLADAVATALQPRFRDGVLFVDLASVTDPALFSTAILRALGGEQEPAPGDIDTLVSRLKTRSVLLILDNMEQLLMSAVDVQRLLVQCSDVTCLVTSRALLRVRGEFEYVVEPLSASNDDTSPAVQLLRDRTRAVLPDAIDQVLSTDLAARICQRVDGLPLAIELAAAQLRMLSPQQLLHRLGGPAGLHGRGAHDLPDRQATMENTVAWSYELLTDDLKMQMSRLSIFTGGFTLEAAQLLLNSPSDQTTIDILQSLIANSLVRSEIRNGSVRFTMLETIRAFGVEQLRLRNLEHPTREAHAMLFRAIAERDGPLLRTETDEQLRIWFGIEDDIANFRAATEWFLAENRDVDAASLVAGLDWFWTDSNYVAEGLRFIAPLTDSPAVQEEVQLLASTLRVRTLLSDMLGQLDILVGLIARALDAAMAAGHTRDLAELYHLSTGVLIDQNQFGAARAMAKRTIQAAEDAGQTWFVGAGQLNLSLVEALDGDFKAALDANRLGLEAYKACGDRDLELSATISNGLVFLLSSDYFRAQECYQSVLNRQLQRIEESFFFQQVSCGIASVVARTGRPELSARIFGMSDAELARSGVTLRKPLLAIFSRYRDGVREALGPEAFDEAWRAGHSLGKIDAVHELNALAAPPVPVDRNMRPAPFNLLSNREFEVLQYLVAGKSDPEIASVLFLSPRTVSQHVSNILSKLQVNSRTAAAAMAARTTPGRQGR